MKIAILGAGWIAQKMAKAIAITPKAEAYAVASRNLEKAQEFANDFGFEKAYGSYEELANDPQVDLIYIATPHSHHYAHTRLVLEHGKHALVEKAFCAHLWQAKELVELAEKKGLLLAEAMWTRYMPSRQYIRSIITSGTIGKVQAISGNVGYPMSTKERLFKPELAGGALLDVGIYPLTFSIMCMEEKIRRISSHATLTTTKVDASESITLEFENGALATLHSTMMAATDRNGNIFGDKGRIFVQNINNPEKVVALDNDNHILSEKTFPQTEGENYEYELISAINHAEKGESECKEMPHAETLRMMELMENLLKEWGVEHNC